MSVLHLDSHQEHRTTKTNSSPSHHHDSTPSRQHPFICTGVEPIPLVHGRLRLRATETMLRNWIHIPAIFERFLTMKAAVASIQEKGKQNLILNLRCLLFSPVRQALLQPCPLQLARWNAYICGNHVSFHNSYFTFATFQMNSKFERHRLVSTILSLPHCMYMVTPQHYSLRRVFFPCTSHRTCVLHNLNKLHFSPPASATIHEHLKLLAKLLDYFLRRNKSNINRSTSFCNYGSPYYRLCPWTHLKAACRLQYAT